MRSLFSAAFFALAAILTLSTNATVWANRTVFDTDRFVGTVDDVLEDDEVQQQLAFRLSTELVAEGNVEARISESLPEGMKPLAPALTVTAQELIQRIALRVLQSDEINDVLEVALAQIHGSVVRILEGKGNVAFTDGAVVLDMHAILQETAADLDRDRNGLLGRVDLPERSGQIVLIEDAPTANAVQDVIALHDEIVWIAVGATVACYVLAVLVARNRRIAIRNAGFVLLATGVLAVVLLAPVRPVVASYAQNPTAAEHVFDHLVNDYRAQSFLLVLGGFALAGSAVLAGDTHLAVAARGTVLQRGGSSSSDLMDQIPRYAPALRLAGLVLGALLLTAWPDPTTRVYVTIIALMAAYFAALWIASSNASGASRIRDGISSLFEHPPGASGDANWVARHANPLRFAGVAVGVLLLVLLPDVRIGTLVAVVAMGLIYLALIDWLASSPEEET